ncbi:MAG: hypothetical protein KZQ84_00520 [Candidatus Thiodiazotropha sp. (ex Lucinoma borealis)]|nr:hypothetical protein [Candidatus Thiodiazotropha sp. (ex Lucinoma borealis)]
MNTKETLGGNRFDVAPSKSLRSLRSKVWFHFVSHKTGLHTGYGLENFLESGRINRSGSRLTRPCKYDRYKRGLHIPRKRTSEKVEKQVPGARYYLNHSFWEVAETPAESEIAIYRSLRRLRPEIKRLIFDNYRDSRMIVRNRSVGLNETFKILSCEADFDALAAAIGLIQVEIHHKNPYGIVVLCARPTEILIGRLIAKPPFSEVADELYQYVHTQFLEHPIDKSYLPDSLSSDDGYRFDSEFTINRYRFLMKLASDLEVFRKYKDIPTASLHIIERYASQLPFEDVRKECIGDNYSPLRKHPIMRNMKRCLRRWEKHHPPSMYANYSSTGQLPNRGQ